VDLDWLSTSSSDVRAPYSAYDAEFKKKIDRHRRDLAICIGPPGGPYRPGRVHCLKQQALRHARFEIILERMIN